MPSKNFSSKEEVNAPGYKKSNDWVSLFICASASASGTDKISVIFLGKSKKPRALKNISVNSFSVKYRINSSA